MFIIMNYLKKKKHIIFILNTENVLNFHVLIVVNKVAKFMIFKIRIALGDILIFGNIKLCYMLGCRELNVSYAVKYVQLSLVGHDPVPGFPYFLIIMYCH